jgi:putative transposase
MPNHFHLLLEQRVDDGITKFLQKMTTSYTMYFNKKYTRNGALLQGTFKRSHIKNDQRLLEISKYIHCNPRKIMNSENEINEDFNARIINYLWSSFADYARLREESRVLSNTQIITDQFNSPEQYIKYVLG